MHSGHGDLSGVLDKNKQDCFAQFMFVLHYQISLGTRFGISSSHEAEKKKNYLTAFSFTFNQKMIRKQFLYSYSLINSKTSLICFDSRFFSLFSWNTYIFN